MWYDVYLRFTGGSGYLMNIDWFTFGTQTAALDGTLIRELKVLDGENAADWSIESDFGEGAMLFGDRDLTCTSLPASLAGAEYIRTACDSKLYTGDLAEMKAGEDMTVYVAIDTRVEPLPAWLSGWTNTGTSLTTSNDLTMNLYSKTLNVGEPLTLGTDGGLNESVNYVVIAKAGIEETIEPAPVRGDLNADGTLDLLDVVLLQKWLLAVPDTSLPDSAAADLDEDGVLDVFDLCMMKRELLDK